MHEICLTESAQRVFDGLPLHQQDEFNEISGYLATAVEALRAADLVGDVVWYGQHYLRYRDNDFPYYIFFNRNTMGDHDPRIVIEVAMLLYSPTSPPTQTQV